MSKFFRLLSLVIVLYSCNREQHSKYYWVNSHGLEYTRPDTTQIIQFTKSHYGDTSKFSYVTKFGSLTYFMITKGDSSIITSNPKNKLVNDNDSFLFMRSFYDTSVVLNSDTLKVKEYILNEFAIDGASIHYYEPTLGIYAVHAKSWPGLKYLQTNDSIINKEIIALIKATVPKIFIPNKLEN